MNNITIGFVFTNFNNAHETGEAIHSIILNEQYSNTFIVIVDNNSNKKTIQQLEDLKNKYSNMDVIFNKDNVGYFKGLNIGIKYIRNKKPEIEYIVIGNNDIIFPINFYESISSNLDKFKEYPIVSPNIITLDNEHQNPHVIKKISKFRELIYDIYFSSYLLAKIIKKIAQITKKFTDRKDEKQHEIAQTIYQGYGACYILGPLFFEHFNSLWSPTFLMGEEFFLSKQLESKGFKIFYEPSIIVRHKLHSSMNNITSKKIWEIARESHKEYRKHVKIWRHKPSI